MQNPNAFMTGILCASHNTSTWKCTAATWQELCWAQQTALPSHWPLRSWEGTGSSRYRSLCLLSLGTESKSSVLRDTECTPGLWGVGSTNEVQAQQPWWKTCSFCYRCWEECSTKCECYRFPSTGTVNENILSRLVSVYIQVNIIQVGAYPVFDLWLQRLELLHDMLWQQSCDGLGATGTVTRQWGWGGKGHIGFVGWDDTVSLKWVAWAAPALPSHKNTHRQASLLMTKLGSQWWKPTICWPIYFCNNCSSPYKMVELECEKHWGCLKYTSFASSSASWPCQQQIQWKKYFPALDSSFFTNLQVV